MGNEPYLTSTAEELAASGHIKLRPMIEILGTTPMWARRLVRDGRVEHARDENGHIWVPTSEVEKYQAERESRRARGVARKSGEMRQAYIPAPIKALKRAKSEAKNSDFSEADIAQYCAMTDEMIAALMVEYEKKIAEKNLPEAESKDESEDEDIDELDE